MPVEVERSTRIDGVYLVRFQKFGDARGYFYETFRKTWIPGVREMVQGNCSFSAKGVLRGLHYHFKQADFWAVPMGRVRAALYDFRAGSATEGKSDVLEIGRDTPAGLYIPRGVAHGFCALEDSIMTYLVDEYYDNSDELGIKWDDPALGLDWGLTEAPVLSGRDAKNPALADIPANLRPR
jgi:dTDP-4-dehydrorhamnose 3,5-epimerase